jgi:hypothetical protein
MTISEADQAQLLAALPAERGLELLAACEPVWPVPPWEWRDVVRTVRLIEADWGGVARRAGWSDLALYGLHREAPYGNLAGMGAAFLLARLEAFRTCRQLISVVTVEAIEVRNGTTGAVQRLARSQFGRQDSVLAWTLVRLPPSMTAAGGC